MPKEMMENSQHTHPCCNCGEPVPNGSGTLCPRCRGGVRVERTESGKMPIYIPPVNTAPCKSCGKDDSVREFGLMCEKRQCESHFTIGVKALQEHLTKAQEQDKAHICRIHEENDRIFERNKIAQAEHNKAHWEQVRAHQAEIDANNRAQMNERGRLAEDRLTRSQAHNDESTRKDQLHRLYTAWLAGEWAKPGFDASQGSVLRDAMTFARSAQAYFEKETLPVVTLTVPPMAPELEARRDAITAEIDKIAALKKETTNG